MSAREDEDDIDHPAKSVVSIWPAVLVVVFGAAIWLTAGDYSAESRHFPRIVAALMVVLGAFDLWSRVDLPGSRIVRDVWGASFNRREMPSVPPLKTELAMALWVLGAFVAMALAGILVALPLFCFAFVRFRSRRSLAEAAGVALVLFVFQYAVFEWLLDYQLYRGLLFSKGGLAQW